MLSPFRESYRCLAVCAVAFALTNAVACADGGPGGLSSGIDLDLEDAETESPSDAGLSSGPSQNRVQANPVGATTVATSGGNDGNAHIDLPIGPIPPGAGGFVPQISLTYNSGAGNSVAGLGWSISGMSTAGECQGGRQCVDGVPLRTAGIDPNYEFLGEPAFHQFAWQLGHFGAPGLNLRTTPDDSARVGVSSWGTGNGDTGHAYYMRDAAANRHLYAYDGSNLASDGSNGQPPSDGPPSRELSGDLLPLAASVDPFDNMIRYRYHYIMEGEYRVRAFYPKSIDWVGAGNTEPTAHIEFKYEDRPDLVEVSQLRGAVDKRLRSITVRAGADSEIARHYVLEYDQGTAGVSRLLSVQECEDDTLQVCKPPVEFVYADRDAPFAFELQPFPQPLELGDVDPEKVWVGDFNGDGRSDVAQLEVQDGNQFGMYSLEVHRGLETGGLSAGITAGKLFQPFEEPEFGVYDREGDGQLEVWYRWDGSDIYVESFDQDVGAFTGGKVCSGFCSDPLTITTVNDPLSPADKLRICRRVETSNPSDPCANNVPLQLYGDSSDHDGQYPYHFVDDQQVPQHTTFCSAAERVTFGGRGVQSREGAARICQEDQLSCDELGGLNVTDNGVDRCWADFPTFSSVPSYATSNPSLTIDDLRPIDGVPDISADLDGDGLLDQIRWWGGEQENEIRLTGGGRDVEDFPVADGELFGYSNSPWEFRYASAIDWDLDGDEELLLPRGDHWVIADFQFPCEDLGAGSCADPSGYGYEIELEHLQIPWDPAQASKVLRVGDFNGDLAPDVLHNFGADETLARIYYGTAGTSSPAWAATSPVEDLIVGVADSVGGQATFEYALSNDDEVYTRDLDSCTEGPERHVFCSVKQRVLLKRHEQTVPTTELGGVRTWRGTDFHYTNWTLKRFPESAQFGFQVVETATSVLGVNGWELEHETGVKFHTGEDGPARFATGLAYDSVTKTYLGDGSGNARFVRTKTEYKGIGGAVVPLSIETSEYEILDIHGLFSWNGAVSYEETQTYQYNDPLENFHDDYIVPNFVFYEDSLGRRQEYHLFYSFGLRHHPVWVDVLSERPGEQPQEIYMKSVGEHYYERRHRGFEIGEKLGWNTYEPKQTQWFDYWDENGNPPASHIEDMTTGVVRTQTNTYDSSGVFLEAVTNPLGHETSYTFDPATGSLTSVTDPNGLTTSLVYDGFGRLVETHYADGTVDHVTYTARDAADGSPTRLTVASTPAVGAPTTALLDDWMRAESAEWLGLDGVPAYVDRAFSPNGSLAWESIPTPLGQSTVGRRTKFEFDRLGRPLRETLPNGDVWWWNHTVTDTTAVDPLGRRTTTQRNGAGEVTSVIDALGSRTCYEYGIVDRVKTIAPLGVDEGRTCALAFASGSRIDIEYDAFGRPTDLHDPALGDVVTTYNGLGERVTVENGAGEVTSFFYDALGRLDYREGDNEETYFEWDKDGTEGKFGLLREVHTSEGYGVEYGFDALSRVVSETYTRGSRQFSYGYGYDQLGRLDSMDYPAAQNIPGLRLSYVYDNFSNLKAVNDVDSGLAYYTAVSEDASGRPTLVDYGTEVHRQYLWDELGGRLNTLMTEANGAFVQAETYTYNPGGALESKTDWMLGQQEEYEYDRLDRILSAEVSANGDTEQTLLTYSGLGDILSKTGIAGYTYGVPNGPNSNPRALLEADGEIFSYDAAGRVLSRGDLDFEYGDMSRITRMTDGVTDLQFAFDPDGSRAVRREVNGTVTTYAGGLFREEASDVNAFPPPKTVSQIAVRGKVIAEVERAESFGGVTEEVRFMLEDRLGSPVVVTDEDGTVQQSMSYDAWGKPRKPEWLEPGEYQNNAGVTVGYTGHEHERDFGLVFMATRHYDSSLGRFISPDIQVDSVWHPAMLNRFQYALGSPTNYVDPTGRYAAPPGCDVHCGVGGESGVLVFPSPSLTKQLLDMARLEPVNRGPRSPSSTDVSSLEGATALGSRKGAGTAEGDPATGRPAQATLAWLQVGGRAWQGYLVGSLVQGLSGQPGLALLAGLGADRLLEEHNQQGGFAGKTYTALFGTEAYNAVTSTEAHINADTAATITVAAVKAAAVIVTAGRGFKPRAKVVMSHSPRGGSTGPNGTGAAISEAASAGATAAKAAGGGALGPPISPKDLPKPPGGNRALSELTQWTEGGKGLAGEAANLARTDELISQLPSRIDEIRAGGVTKEMANTWARFYRQVAAKNPATKTGGNPNAKARAKLMDAIARHL